MKRLPGTVGMYVTLDALSAGLSWSMRWELAWIEAARWWRALYGTTDGWISLPSKERAAWVLSVWELDG